MTDVGTQIRIKPKNKAVPRNSKPMVFFRPNTSMITRVTKIPREERKRKRGFKTQSYFSPTFVPGNSAAVVQSKSS